MCLQVGAVGLLIMGIIATHCMAILVKVANELCKRCAFQHSTVSGDYRYITQKLEWITEHYHVHWVIMVSGSSLHSDSMALFFFPVGCQFASYIII